MSLKLAKLVKKQKTNELQAELLQTLPSPPPPAAAAAPPPSSVRTNVLLLENEVGCSDLTKLDEIDEESFVQNLKVRFLNKQIYTCIESTVIALNPYESLPLYSTEVIAAYEHHNILALPPHIYALCEYVLYCLKERNTDQCILTSGVSGSGKSESLKLALDYFIYGSNERTELNLIKTRLHSIPLVLEAFGNACTEHNHNSTRLVYMLEIDFDFRGDPLGGQISDYFVEKTRISRHEIYGLNFHIFYQLLSGASLNLLKFLKLKRNIEAYYLLKDNKQSEWMVNNAQNHGEQFAKTKLTLQVLGFTSNEIVECLQVLAIILKLGNVQFLRRANIDSTEGCTVLNHYELVEICEMFKLDCNIFVKLLTQKVVKNQNDVYVAELSANSASKIKHSLCKALYFRLFTWLIGRINELVKTKPSANLTRNNLSLFDSFGFENYNINFIEQLLINYLFEKTEQIFVDINHRQEQELYLHEDIEWSRVVFSSNDTICNLIELPSDGILSILHDDCSKPAHFREENFMQDLNKRCANNLHYIAIANPVQMDSDGNGYFLYSLPYRRVSAGDAGKTIPQLCFGIRHFNDSVVYSVNGFIEKNTDHLSRYWSHFMYQTDHCLLKTLFPEGNPLRKNPKNPITLASQFCISIESIIAKLENKEIHFIKCICPNRLKIPNLFDEDYVYKQLCSQFLIEHSEFIKRGYFYKEHYGPFFQRFRILSPQTWPLWFGTAINGVFVLLHNLFNADLSQFNFGKTKIFIKHMKTLMELEEYRLVKLAEVAVKIQKNIRRWLQRRWYIRIVICQIKIGRFYRNWKRKKYLLWLARHLPSRSPISQIWPPAPRSMRETSFLLRRLFHKWRCHRYRLRFDQTNRNRMREKVTAMRLFRNKKSSYINSVSHPFRGDYIRLRQNAKWKRLLPTLGTMYVVFADLVSKVTKRCGKFVHKLIVISTNSFVILDPRTMQIDHQIELKHIGKISTSPYMDNILIIHIDSGQVNSRAFIFESSHLIELVTKLFLVIQNAIGRRPIVEISNEFQVHTAKETLVLIFKRKQRQQQQQSETPASNEVRISRKSNRLEFSTH